jgi:predicted transcriptional regulator
VEILNVCREPKVKTQVMYETDITLKKLQFCLKQLMKQDMLEFHHRRKNYATTDKGLRYLQIWTEL